MSSDIKELYNNAIENDRNGNYELAKSQYEECIKQNYNVGTCAINLAFLLKKLGYKSDDPVITRLLKLYQDYMNGCKFFEEYK
jgi:hypothetical protein